MTRIASGLSWFFIATLAVAFVAAAVVMGLMASTGGRWPHGEAAWLMVAGTVLAGLLLAAGPVLTFGRGKFGTGLLVLPMLVMCSWFSAQSTIKFCREHLLDAAAAREREGASYAVAARRVAELRSQRAEAGKLEARDAGLIRSQIEERLAEALAGGGTVASRSRRCQEPGKAPEACADVWKLEIAAKTADRRDDIDRRLGEAVAALARLRPIAEARPDAGDGGAVAGYLDAVRRVTGLEIATTEELRAVSFALLIWLGEWLMPMVLALASGREGGGTGAGWALSRRVSSRMPAADTGLSARGTVERWVAERIDPRAGGRGTAGGRLYEDFQVWARRGGHEMISNALFGMVLARDLGWPKRKSGKAGLIVYQGVALKPLAGAGLHVVDGGRA